MTLELACGARRYLNESSEVVVTSSAATFGQIRFDRIGCPAQLARQAELFNSGKRLRPGVNIQCQRMCSLPNLEIAKVLHGKVRRQNGREKASSIPAATNYKKTPRAATSATRGIRISLAASRKLPAASLFKLSAWTGSGPSPCKDRRWTPAGDLRDSPSSRSATWRLECGSTSRDRPRRS